MLLIAGLSLLSLLAPAEGGSRDPNAERLARQYQAMADAMVGISEIYYLQGRQEEGYRLLDLGLALARQPEAARRDEARLKIAYAKLLQQELFYRRTGFERGAAMAREARALAEGLGDRALAAEAIHELARLHYGDQLWRADADYAEVLALYEQALAIRREIGDRRGEVQSRFGVGLVHERRKQADRALELHRGSLQLAETGGFKLEASYLHRHIAFIVSGQGDEEAAFEGFRKSLALREEVGFRVGIPFAHIALGDAWAAKREPEAARRHYEQALEGARALDLKVAVVFSLLSMGDLEAEAGREDAALELFGSALAAAEAVPFERGIREARARIAKAKSS
jgi:tetratricopeptide (TPR) repeat protein